MKFNFQQQTEDGLLVFSGELQKSEVDYLLQYAIVDLMHKGAFVKQLKVIEDDDDENPTIRH